MPGLDLSKVPRRIVFGPGEIRNLARHAADLGRKAFVVMDPFLRGSPAAGGILRDLSRTGMRTVEFYDVSSNPRNTSIDRAGMLCRQEGCDIVTAIGGGSAIDTAKMVSIIATSGRTSWDYVSSRNQLLPERALPLIAVPTTSGTGTESTHIAVVTNTELQQKYGFAHELLVPALAILDPELTVSLPPSLTAYTGIDAFTHCFESLLVPKSNSFSEAVAYEGIHLFVENVEECVRDGSSITARGKMSICSTFGGMAIASGGTTWPHGIGQTLSGKYDVPHGAALACCLSEVIRATLPVGTEVCARVARIFDPTLGSLPLEQQAARLPSILDEFFGRILPRRPRMSDYGMSREEVPEFVELMFRSGNDYGQRVHPRRFEKQDLRRIVESCL